MKYIVPLTLLLVIGGCASSERKRPVADTAKTQNMDMRLPAEIQDTAIVSRVRTYLQQSLEKDLKSGFVDSLSRRFTMSQIDLNEDGKSEIFVGLTGPYFCGSGGCSWILLDANGLLINRFTVSAYPVWIAKEKSEGWRNLIIYSEGKKHLMKFAKGRYPGNPSTQPLTTTDVDNFEKALDVTAPKHKWLTF